MITAVKETYQVSMISIINGIWCVAYYTQLWMPTGGSCIQCSHMQMHAQKHYLLVGEANYRTKKKIFSGKKMGEAWERGCPIGAAHS